MAQAEWAAALRKIEALDLEDDSVAGAIDRWLAGDATADMDRTLSAAMLGAIEIPDPKSSIVRLALAVPARINELAERLGATYWQALAKAPPRIVISRAATHRIRDVRYSALLLDVGAWRAWALEHRDPASLTNEELIGFVDRLVALADELDEVRAAEKDVIAEAKGRGWDTKVLRKIVGLVRTEDGVAGWQEFSSMVDLYLANIGRDAPPDEEEEPPAAESEADYGDGDGRPWSTAD